MVRNIEPRNVAMCRERSEFVSACIDSEDFSSCASIGTVLRIDSVTSVLRPIGMVITDQPTGVLEVQCTVVGRVRLVACENLEAWRKPSRDEYLMADVETYEDEEPSATADATADATVDATADATLTTTNATADEGWWMGAQAAGDVANAFYRLVDGLLESADVDGKDAGLDVDAAVAALERAAEFAEDGNLWAALDLWQVHCATRLAHAAALHRAERNEFVIDAALRRGGALKLPVPEYTLKAEDRAALVDLDARAADAASQMGLDDTAAFQACLEARQEATRAKLLLRGVQREADRLARRVALRRSLDVS